MRNRNSRARLAVMGLIVLAGTATVHADNFVRVVYDPKSDELVVTIAYRGTNPDHSFTLQWGECKPTDDGGNQLDAEILDSQAGDGAEQPFKTTTRFGLGDIPCRPAILTLRTAPRFIYSIKIPDSPPAQP